MPGSDYRKGNPAIELTDFAAHVHSRFNISRIEPWSKHFSSLDSTYLDQLRAAVAKAAAAIVNIAVDGDHSPYAADPAERSQAVTFGKLWVDVASRVGSPSIRVNIPTAKDSRPNLNRAAESMQQLADYASGKNVVVNLEPDNPVSEDPFFLAELLKKVNSPWLRALPDFANILAHHDAGYAYRGIQALFRHAYCICHVKDAEENAHGTIVQADLRKTFAYLKQSGFKGFCSIEWDRPGDPYQGTAGLIDKTVQYLA